MARACTLPQPHPCSSLTSCLLWELLTGEESLEEMALGVLLLQC